MLLKSVSLEKGDNQELSIYVNMLEKEKQKWYKEIQEEKLTK